MQLIYGFRGSRPERLQRHVEESQREFELRTPHRWHQDEGAGRWLLAVRTRLVGNPDPTPAPPSLKVIRERYFNAMMTHVKIGAANAFRDGMASVAVLAAWNSDIGKLRTYLCKQGLYPRQLGSGDDFEEACGDIEQLPLLGDIQSVAHHAIERIAKLVPTLPRTVAEQVRRRLGTSDVDLSGNCGKEARGLLEALRPLYAEGSHRYVASIPPHLTRAPKLAITFRGWRPCVRCALPPSCTAKAPPIWTACLPATHKASSRRPKRRPASDADCSL